MNSKTRQLVSKEWRILLWGRTGYGRSTVGNAILGKDCFPTGQSASSVTKEYMKMTREFDGQTTLAVVDTPGVLCTDTDKKGMMKGILESSMSIQPGPHVILLVLQCNEFSAGDEEVLEIFKTIFQGAEAYTIPVVTHANQQQAEKFLNSEPRLNKFVKKFCAFDEHSPDKDEQVHSLGKMIEKVVENNNSTCYSNKLINMCKDELEKKLQFQVNAEPKRCIAELVGLIMGICPPELKKLVNALTDVACHWTGKKSKSGC